jgi:hypothetical protein
MKVYWGGKWSASNTECFTPGKEPPIPNEKEAACTHDTLWTIWTEEKYLAQKVRVQYFILKQPHCCFTVFVVLKQPNCCFIVFLVLKQPNCYFTVFVALEQPHCYFTVFVVFKQPNC